MSLTGARAAKGWLGNEGTPVQECLLSQSDGRNSPMNIDASTKIAGQNAVFGKVFRRVVRSQALPIV
jgi:hypothetical protein